MKLKGKNAEKLNKDKREKMERTLSTMQKVREKDSRTLRDIAQSKLKWAVEEKDKGEKTIKNLLEQVNRIKVQTVRLSGAIAILNDLLNLKKE